MFRSTILLSLLVFSSPSQATADIKVTKGIAYSQDGANRNQTSLDVYAPETGKDLPVMIWIHGGAWRIGDKSRLEEKPKVFNDKGFVFVSINYRLDPMVDYKGQGTDVAKAIRYVHDHAPEFHGAPDQIFLMGHSAGAHLAALVATNERYLEAEKLKLSAIKGVILLDGAAYDIPHQIELAALPKMKEMYRSVFTNNLEKQKDASPINHVSKDKGIPPFLILYVASRRDGKIQSEALGARLKDAGIGAQVSPAENKTHATINREFGLAEDIPTKQAFEFLAGKIRSAKAPR
ncbi:MAG: Alpha/beta hydrolase fold-3 domain protein [Planctomycetaceae bacterium]|nr:Alpha/beta hydrolase fold-3 domain protein [Planctomycetaceae bacterium]